MKKLVLTTALSLIVGGSCLAQGFFTFDNSANYTGSSNAYSIVVGNVGAAGEGAYGASLGSGASPNYDVSYLYLAGTTYTGQSLTPSQFITDGASFATNINNAAASYGSFAAVTGDAADGAGFFQDGATHIAGAADGSLYTIELIAWYDPTGTTTFLQALADGYNIGGSTLNTIRMAAGLDNVIADASGFSGFAVNPVPEPTTLALFGLGGAALLAIRRRKV